MSECGRCRDCKHYDDKSVSGDFHYCDLSYEDWFKAFAPDSEGDRTWMRVLPDFGCVQFEAKEGKPCTTE